MLYAVGDYRHVLPGAWSTAGDIEAQLQREMIASGACDGGELRRALLGKAPSFSTSSVCGGVR